MEGYTAIEKAIRYFDAHKGIVETLYVKEIVDKLIEFKVEEAKVKNLAQPDVIREVCECESDYLQCNEFGKCPQCGKDWR